MRSSAAEGIALLEPPAGAPLAVRCPAQDRRSGCGDFTMRELAVGVEPDTTRQLDAMTSVSTRLQKGDTALPAG